MTDWPSKPTSPRGKCRYRNCPKPSEVAIGISAKTSGIKPVQLTSMTRVLCDEHGKEVYETLMQNFALLVPE